jgi:hypothetical protein
LNWREEGHGPAAPGEIGQEVVPGTGAPLNVLDEKPAALRSQALPQDGGPAR